MWWMLLIYTLEGYQAEQIYSSLEQCEQEKITEQDLCLAVEIRFINS